MKLTDHYLLNLKDLLIWIWGARTYERAMLPAPPQTIIRVGDTDLGPNDGLTSRRTQKQYAKSHQEWQTKYDIVPPKQDETCELVSKDGKLVVSPDLGAQEKVMYPIHDDTQQGNPGRMIET